MFIENKYTKWYYSIINNAKTKQRSKTDDYFESHHIVPKSLGGLNHKDNLILLTAKEHFVCHALLTRMLLYKSTEYFKMLHALMLMKGGNKFQYRSTSPLYEKAKKEYSVYISSKMKGKSHSFAHNEKISNSLKGKSMSDDTKKKISIKASSRKRKPFSEEYKLKMSTIMKQRHRWSG